MVILENIVIIALFGAALGYIIKLISKAFIKGESAGCASCGGGCHTQIPEFPLDEKS